MTFPLWFYVGIFALSGLFSTAALGFARRRQLVDIPNARSSHNLPTPKGGGIGFAVLISLILLIAGAASNTATGVYVLMLGSAALALSITGLVDDLRPLPSATRLVIQLLAGIAILFFLPTISIDLGFMRLPQTAFICLALLFLLWTTNLYNFMDGIDGIACAQAILLGAAIYSLDALGFYSGELAHLGLAIAACLGGFLLFNFPPAKMFMGDAGSVFLGFTLGAMALFETATAAENLWIWLILLAVFVCDATATLVSRLVQGQKFYQAHRSHIYQLYTRSIEERLRRAGMADEQARARAHRRYLLLFSLFFCLIQFPLATAVAAHWLPGLLVTLLTYGLLLGGFMLLGAGRDRLFFYRGIRKK